MDPQTTPKPFNRWFIPVAALLIHICIGSVYAWSTFNKPINAILKVGADSWVKAPYITYSTALILLGLSAEFGGPWVERNGPRKTALFSMGLFCTGLVIGGFGLSSGPRRSYLPVWGSCAASVADLDTSRP